MIHSPERISKREKAGTYQAPLTSDAADAFLYFAKCELHDPATFQLAHFQVEFNFLECQYGHLSKNYSITMTVEVVA